MVFRTAVTVLGKPVGALMLGGAILSQVAARVGPASGRAVVHVSTTPVTLTVDDNAYCVEDWSQTPVVCELKPGRHAVRMIRDAAVLYIEEFQVAAGEDIVLTAWDQYRDGRSPGMATDRITGSGSAPGSFP